MDSSLYEEKDITKFFQQILFLAMLSPSCQLYTRAPTGLSPSYLPVLVCVATAQARQDQYHNFKLLCPLTSFREVHTTNSSPFCFPVHREAERSMDYEMGQDRVYLIKETECCSPPCGSRTKQPFWVKVQFSHGGPPS